jgi:lipopolysaccharide transport system permease protein
MSSFAGTLNALRNLAAYRGRVVEGVIHDVRKKYVGSVLGMFWVALFPLVQLSIYAGLYTIIFRVRVSGLGEWGYVLLVFSGLVPLLAFNEILNAATNSLHTNKNLLLNTVFPAELIPLRAGLTAHVSSLFGLVATLLLGYAQGRTGWEAVVFVPVFWLLLVMFAIAVGWMFSLLALVAKDIQHGLGLISMLLIILSPFAFTPEMVPTLLKPIIYLNPLSYFVLSFQKLITYGTLPDLIPAIGCVVLGVGGFLVSFTLFQRAKSVFFDYV